MANTSWSLFKFRKRVIAGLVNCGYEVHLIAPEDEYISELKQLGAFFHPLNSLERKGTNPLSEIKLLAELYSLYKKIKPNLIYHYTIKPNIYGSIIAKALDIPCIAVVTGLGYTFINKGFLSRIASILYTYSFRMAEEVWFLNDDDAEVFLKRKILIPSKAKIINGEGIDCLNEFNPSCVKGQDFLNEDGSRVKFLYIGRLLYDKGIREFVQAAEVVRSKYENVEFNILGFFDCNNPAGVTEAEFNKWQRSGLINYLGSKDDVRSVILEHSCVVLPSYREGMSTVLQESAALGRPLIATDIPGCKELIEHNRTGYLCRPKDFEDLADKMVKFLTIGAVSRRQMGSLGREKIIRECNDEIVLGLYLAKVRELLADKTYVSQPN